MKQLFILFFLFCYTANAQDFSFIEQKVANYPKFIKIEDLATKISNDFTSKEQQVKATFYWLATNIRYDLDGYFKPRRKRISFRYRNEQERLEKLQAIKDEIITETLLTKKALCEGYAQTFAKVCNLLEIENEVIKGYVRNSANDINNPKPSSNHAWNAVKLDDKWIYVDATWAAGAVTNNVWTPAFNDYYYNIKKSNYFKTHYPEDTLWQLRVSRIEKEDFYNQPIYHSAFLKSNLQLVSPKKGTINGKNTVEIQLKNLPPSKSVFLGYSGYRYAIKPNTVTTKNNITTITTSPPENSKQLFLIVDKKIMLEFLLE